MKYLSIQLDSALSFKAHIRITSANSEKTVNALSRLMPNIGGPSEKKRRVLGAVTIDNGIRSADMGGYHQSGRIQENFSVGSQENGV